MFITSPSLRQLQNWAEAIFFPKFLWVGTHGALSHRHARTSPKSVKKIVIQEGINASNLNPDNPNLLKVEYPPQITEHQIRHGKVELWIKNAFESAQLIQDQNILMVDSTSKEFVILVDTP